MGKKTIPERLIRHLGAPSLSLHKRYSSSVTKGELNLSKAQAEDYLGRFREIVSDPINLLIERAPQAGYIFDNRVVLHNGLSVPVYGSGSYYDNFSDILIVNRGVHEPVEEYLFQEYLKLSRPDPIMLELGAYWGHYSMWLQSKRPKATTYLVEPDPNNLSAGKNNFGYNNLSGVFIGEAVGPGAFEVDAFVDKNNLTRLDILHSDIQGAEFDMLHGANRSLAKRLIDRCFISTHSKSLHLNCKSYLESHNYEVECSLDPDTESTSFDGLLVAHAPLLPPLAPNFHPIGRQQIAQSDSQSLFCSLLQMSNAARD
jgi:hypothetical protein